MRILTMTLIGLVMATPVMAQPMTSMTPGAATKQAPSSVPSSVPSQVIGTVHTPYNLQPMVAPQAMTPEQANLYNGVVPLK